MLSALAFGATSVTAVEINKDIIRTVNERFGDFTGHLDRDPRVRFVNDEARSFIARSAERFDSIQISLIDTWAATAAGAFVLSENSIYTVEAWQVFLNHLTDDGLLSVSRWYFRDRPAEMYRTTTLAVEALRAIGVAEPRQHIAIVRNMRLANRRAEIPDGVGTLLVSRRPFTAEELDRLDAESARLGFEVSFSPRVASDDTFVRLTTPQGLDAFLAAYPINITAPTDDSPFFFNMLRLRDVLRPELLDFGKQSHNMKAVATLAILLATVTILTALCILLPLWLTRDRVNLKGVGPLFAFFISIGLGFMLIETSQMQRLIIALGHPTYGLSVVLFAVLLSSGIGSFLTRNVTAETAPALGRRRMLAVVVVLAVFGFLTPPIVRWIEPMTTVRPHRRRRGAALSGRPRHGDGVPPRPQARRRPRVGTDRLALGPERRRVGHGLGPERLHCADLVDLDRLLGRLALLRRGVRGVQPGITGLKAQGSGLRQNLGDLARRSCLSLEP